MMEPSNHGVVGKSLHLMHLTFCTKMNHRIELKMELQNASKNKVSSNRNALSQKAFNGEL